MNPVFKQVPIADTTFRARHCRRILYLMHVDWRWIKQRPQFLAEGLSAEHDVQVLYVRALRKRGFPPNCRDKILGLPLLPIPWRLTSFGWAKALHRQWVAMIARRFRPDTIWITHPNLFNFLPRRLMNFPIIYDCMDDAIAMAHGDKEIGQVAELEQRLVECSTKILCSSSFLRDLLAERYTHNAGQKLSVVRNAVSAKLLAGALGQGNACKSTGDGTCRIAYIGTVAEWLDFDALLDCLAARPLLEFHLIGPVTVAIPPKHERLCYHGPIPHDALREYANQFDAFFMPFKITPIILSVDPVKLYEYLAIGKEVFSVRYPEITRFEHFIHFYNTTEEFIELIDSFAAGKLRVKNRPDFTRGFLEQNTWPVRVAQIQALLDGVN